MSDPELDLITLDATDMVAALGRGTVRSRTLIEAHLDRIDRYDDRLGAYIDVYREDALRAADGADAARAAGHAVGPLHGIPVAVKDIVDIEGRITTGGSMAWRERRSPATATLVERMVGAGMIVLGKTHTVEFAMGSFGTNEHLGSPRNPWDPDLHRAPGGSSAGSGVGVASGLAPWAIGTDTGGSVRIPSAWCGLAGLKTTIGRISVHGVLPLSQTLDTPGPMCRSVRDAALLYRVLAGADPRDPRTLVHPVQDPIPGLERGIAGLRLARLPDRELDRVDPEVAAAFEDSLAVLSSLGATVEPVDLPGGFDEMGAHVGRIIGAEGYAHVGHLTDDPHAPIDKDVRPRIGLGRNMSARDYLHLLRDQQRVKADFDTALAGHDALLTPTVATPAPVVDEIDQSGTAAGFTRPFNLVERCAVAVVNGFVGRGLPSSLQIVCAGHAEALALRIARAYEAATAWRERRPPGLG